MIKLSVGTAHVLGLKELTTDAPPTTAYLLVGETCRQNCSFCAQAAGSSSHRDNLSRVRWQEYDLDRIVTSLDQARDKFDRICLQAVDNPAVEAELTELLTRLQEIGLPICVSKKISSVGEVEELLQLGADKVTIALDAVGPPNFSEIKEGSYQAHYQLLKEAAKEFSGRIATHLIVGLGETEEELINLLLTLNKWEVTAGLFAFTPVQGTELANRSRPKIANYRRIQIAHHLIYEHDYSVEKFIFEQERLVNIKGNWESLLTSSTFATAGCPGCNRPYYNERPGRTMYNYPRLLTEEELAQAREESELIEL